MASKTRKNNLRIAELMQERGMTFADLAEKITRTDEDNNVRSLAAPTLFSRVNGNPSLSSLYEIADALGVKVTELFPEEDQPDRYKFISSNGFTRVETVCKNCGQKICVSISAE